MNKSWYLLGLGITSEDLSERFDVTNVTSVISFTKAGLLLYLARPGHTGYCSRRSRALTAGILTISSQKSQAKLMSLLKREGSNDR